MEISEVKIHLIKPSDGLLGFASMIINDQLYISGIAIYQRFDGSGYRITYPTRKIGDRQLQMFHPIRRECGIALEESVINKMKEVASIDNDRYHSYPVG